VYIHRRTLRVSTSNDDNFHVQYVVSCFNPSHLTNLIFIVKRIYVLFRSKTFAVLKLSTMSESRPF